MAKEPTPSTIDERLTWNEGDLELFDADGNPIEQDVIDEKDAPKPAVTVHIYPDTEPDK